MIFSLLLTKEREKQGISQERLCRGLCAVSALSRYENGERIPDRLLMNAFDSKAGKEKYFHGPGVAADLQEGR